MITPARDYQRTRHHRPEKLLTGLDAALHGLKGSLRRPASVVQRLRLQAAQVEALAPAWKTASDHVLATRLEEFRQAFRRRPDDPDLPTTEALAAIREAADRQVGLRPFAVQMMGALAMHQGYLAEMATGEGKTLTAGLCAVLAGWTARPCHIITANDYLAQRDAEWLRPLYRFSGLKAGHTLDGMPARDRQLAYQADITYTTSKEIVADFLRDRLRLSAWQNPTRRLIRSLTSPGSFDGADLVMRGLHTAIVDEADCLLIDEAVTPLIISAPHENELLREATSLAQTLAASLEPERDYTLSHRFREVHLTSAGRARIEAQSASLPRLFRSLSRREELIRQALVAREFFLPGKQYAVLDNKVVIVDEYTGRLMPQRAWRAGLHQAIEAKEGLAVSDPTETLARLSFQRFFRLFYKLAGMTGTASEAASEFWRVYQLKVIPIPTNKPCIRREIPDEVLPDADSKWRAVVEEIQRLHAEGRPILVGTRSIAASEHLATLLQSQSLPFQILNAIHHREEAQIVAQAGQAGRITIATNMAGRGTDIRLNPGVAELGGLHVIATERHEAHRVDRQLFGRSARQGDPGSARAFVGLDDELLIRYLPARILRVAQTVLRARLPGAHVAAALLIRLAQTAAKRQAFRQRRAVLRTDTWLDEALSFAESGERMQAG